MLYPSQYYCTFFRLLVQVLISLAICFPVLSKASTLFIKNTGEHENTYIRKLINESIGQHYTPTLSLRVFPEKLTKERMLRELGKGFIDVAWTTESVRFRNNSIEIPIALFNNLFGHRLLLIRKGEQYKFDNISSVDDLSNLLGGQGNQWRDTSVLKSSGLQIVTATDADILTGMLLSERIDYFPRALHEAWLELKEHSSLTVENNLMLVYQQPVYFYVTPKKPKLAKALLQGLTRLQNSGQLNNFFNDNSFIQKTLRLSNIKNRKALLLENDYRPTSLHTLRN
ncbi:MAG: hypothetical protein GJ680_20660 [Alteromonadaceae bacterium]|nr:hypothetical protein [Alteromonadaceae bacterium]